MVDESIDALYNITIGHECVDTDSIDGSGSNLDN